MAFLSKLRKKILSILLGDGAYEIVNSINKQGKWYLIQKYAPENKYPDLLSDWYFESTGTKLNLKNPQTYNEKVQWLKLYESTPLKTQLSDKYLVRNWITEKIGVKYLVPLLGVWDNFDEIDFNKLPNQFVLKANHGSGWLIIVKNKSKFNIKEAKQRFDVWMNTNFAYCAGLELQYHDIKPKIIAEQYLEDESGGLADYKFYCFEGKPYSVAYFGNRFKKGGYKAKMYNLDWEPTCWTTEANHESGILTKKPENFDEMKDIISLLCKDFHHVRIDLYSINGLIYFGEMTFTSGSGIEHFKPEEWNLKLGEMIKLPIDI